MQGWRVASEEGGEPTVATEGLSAALLSSLATRHSWLRGPVPDLDGPVVAGRGQAVSVRAKGDGAERFGVPSQGQEFLPRRAPHPHGFVVARRRQPPPPAVGEAAHRPRVPAQGPDGTSQTRTVPSASAPARRPRGPKASPFTTPGRRRKVRTTFPVATSQTFNAL